MRGKASLHTPASLSATRTVLLAGKPLFNLVHTSLLSRLLLGQATVFRIDKTEGKKFDGAFTKHGKEEVGQDSLKALSRDRIGLASLFILAPAS